MQGYLLSKFLVQRECIPLPGPPEEKELALPINTRKILYNSILGLLKLTPGRATANSKKGPSLTTLSILPSYVESSTFIFGLFKTTWD
jgi:hypothetical protein